MNTDRKNFNCPVPQIRVPKNMVQHVASKKQKFLIDKLFNMVFCVT